MRKKKGVSLLMLSAIALMPQQTKQRSNANKRKVGQCETANPEGCVCADCRKLKPWGEFPIRTDRNQYRSICKVCYNKNQKTYRERK
jgi:hypothetical protein